MSQHAIANAKAWLSDIVEKAQALTAAEQEGDHDAADTFREECQQDALSVSVRTGWYSPGAKEDATPEEFEILLSTGGPALRIVGDLDAYCQPSAGRLQWQDWGTPWTDLTTTNEEDSAIETYIRCYWFGE